MAKKWLSYNIRLGADRYTMGDDRVGPTELMDARYLQLVNDLAPKPLKDLRVLDLGAGEGLYGLELALQGATVLAIEGREEPAENARYAAAALGIDERYEIRVADVRDLSVERYGTFDVVLCLGILYHLEAPDVFRLVRATHELSESLVVFRTAVGLRPREAATDARRTYHGFVYSETKTRWASLDNLGASGSRAPPCSTCSATSDSPAPSSRSRPSSRESTPWRTRSCS
jgi:SAM-dependent methyltransferase